MDGDSPAKSTTVFTRNINDEDNHTNTSEKASIEAQLEDGTAALINRPQSSGKKIWNDSDKTTSSLKGKSADDIDISANRFHAAEAASSKKSGRIRHREESEEKSN